MATTQPEETFAVRIAAMRARVDDGYRGLDKDTRVLLDTLDTDTEILGFLTLREQLKGFIPDEELSNVALELLLHASRREAGTTS